MAAYLADYGRFIILTDEQWQYGNTCLSETHSVLKKIFKGFKHTCISYIGMLPQVFKNFDHLDPKRLHKLVQINPVALKQMLF